MLYRIATGYVQLTYSERYDILSMAIGENNEGSVVLSKRETGAESSLLISLCKEREREREREGAGRGGER